MKFKEPTNRNPLLDVEMELRARIQQEEAAHFSRAESCADSLWGHSVRVAEIAENLGSKEGVNLTACRLAGIFHDSGKFENGEYHNDGMPEEQRSVKILREMTKNKGLDDRLVDQVEESILQVYRNDPNPTLLTKILFDADNLDKLGLLGISNFFIKAGLRGRGFSQSLLYRVTVELTYARYAADCFATESGKDLARRRALDTIEFFKKLLASLREDRLFTFHVNEVTFNGLTLDVVEPPNCNCGRKISRRIRENPGIKCEEIHLEHFCDACGLLHKLRFCSPRIIN